VGLTDAYIIVLFTSSGESTSVDPATVEGCKIKLLRVITLWMVYNVDRTVDFFLVR
jgi:hypothetical protein